jgi:hypothetical protein
MWVAKGGRFAPPAAGLPARFRFGDNNKSVGPPSTAKRVVSVGSYVTKNRWVSINGSTYAQVGAVVGNLSVFSSLGPSGDGRIKPDITAPGEAILAALSKDYTTVQAPVVLSGGGLQKLQGTSMASPHIAGIVALMLQKNRYLTYENVIALLTGTARSTGGNPNNSFGAGKVDALAALNATPVGVDCANLARITGIDCEGNRIYSYALLDAYPNPFNPSTTLSYILEKPELTELIVFDVLGKPVRTLVDEPRTAGLHTAMWDGRDDEGSSVASGMYFVRLLTPSYFRINRIVLTK